MFDPKKLLAEKGTIQAIEALLKSAYEQGRRDASAAILAAAQLPFDQRPVAPSLIGGAGHPKDDERARKAPRGTVPKVLGRMLTERPGKTIVEYEEMVPNYDDRISVKSIGNELRRMEGKRYRRNDDGGWFLIKSDGEAGGDDQANSPASDNTYQGGPLWNRPNQ